MQNCSAGRTNSIQIPPHAPDFKVVEKPVNIFVSKFLPNVLESEIKQFAQSRFKSATTVIVEKLKTKFDSYSLSKFLLLMSVLILNNGQQE